MSLSGELIDFDIIETHKENIQSLPGGRSARALASIFSPSPYEKRSGSPTHSNTRNLNDAIRQEYEKELIAISEYDDPLDIYDRYVKWTLGAYPSAQATPESQLLPLLERATKAFLSSSHYKNDPRYLKLWLHYVRLFSDTPRETFAFLARHNIGEGLALFYEEFAAWLEGAGRWTQAEEVYKLGLEREARPAERLLRKFGEFQHRFEQRPQSGDEPSSPALPTVRPALAAKIDPFAAATPRSTDPQAAQPQSGIAGSSTGRPGRQKLAIFSDADPSASATKGTVEESTKGWENIGSLQDRKKENTMEPRPWAGETLKGGKRVTGAPKMMIFKDESVSDKSLSQDVPKPRIDNPRQVNINPRTGKAESVLANMEAIYPDWPQMSTEMSFEELRAAHRGWLSRDWSAEGTSTLVEDRQSVDDVTQKDGEEQPDPVPEYEDAVEERLLIEEEQEVLLESTVEKEGSRESRSARPKKMKIMEVKGEPQTIKANLQSPTGPKLRRKISAEPTMTVHTRAATDEIYGIFSQPLKKAAQLDKYADSTCESDFDDDDYTSAGESTGTGRISGTSEFGDDETGAKTFEENETGIKSVSEWSDFTASKHVPRVDEDGADDTQHGLDEAFVVLEDNPAGEDGISKEEELVTPISPHSELGPTRTRFIPLPPEDYEPPTHRYRDASQASQNRLPFMTPIVEKTESSLAPGTIYQEKDYFNSKTPSRRHGDGTTLIPELEDELFSPFREIINEAETGRKTEAHPIADLERTTGKPHTAQGSANTGKNVQPKRPVIPDAQCNPVDDNVRQTILDCSQPPLASYDQFFEHKGIKNGKGAEIRKYAKAVMKMTKNSSDKTTTNVSMPPVLRFEGAERTYTIKRELGKGAFAPVYLAETASCEEDDDEEGCNANGRAVTRTGQSNRTRKRLEAVKMEDPPTAWEFYIMRLAAHRLGPSCRAAHSIIQAHELHLFADECFLIEEYRDQGTLLDLVNLAKADPTSISTCSGTTSGAAAVMDETLAMFFTVELFRTVEALHANGILHGDLKADNCLVRFDPVPSISSSASCSPPCVKTDDTLSSHYHPSGSHGWSAKGLALIDFGRGIDMRAFRDDVQFVADWKTGPADCVEMREMRPWTWQVDYWALAGVVHVLLWGRYIDTVVVNNSTTTTNGSEKGQGAEERLSLDLDLDLNLDGFNGLSLANNHGNINKRKQYKPKEPLKRYWQVELWNRVFDILLNPLSHVDDVDASSSTDQSSGSGSGSGGKLPILNAMRACREGLEEWLEANAERRGLKSLIMKLEGACRERGRK